MAWCSGGNGGLIVTFRLNFSSYDNTAMADLVGVDPAQLTTPTHAGSAMVNLLDAGHPLSANQTDPYQLLGGSFLNCQSVTTTWPNALLPGATFIQADSGTANNVIAYNAASHRGVWFTAYPEYLCRIEGERALYNSILWTSF